MGVLEIASKWVILCVLYVLLWLNCAFQDDTSALTKPMPETGATPILLHSYTLAALKTTSANRLTPSALEKCFSP